MRTALRGTGQLLMTLGVVALLFGVYSLYGTGLQTAPAQSELRIPRLGQDYDPVTVEHREQTFTYRIVSREIVAPDDVAVILPVPRQPEATPKQALLTLITCHPQYSARQRLILTAALERTDQAADAGTAA